ncbi:hypothetical protein [uncultured Shewanella sp.]|uniref:hypothetical protein n=1 Tax=uncultured Shewanella sp. TaxID=173975 RepID=UPI0026201716|nr:hypothetical protein [uncultured Shewanella sp.]
MRYCNFLLFFMSFSVFSANWPYSEKVLQEELKSTYAKLEARTGYCGDLRQREITAINSDWLLSLTEQQQRIVLFNVSNIAFDRCVEKEEGDYNTALINYTAKTKDMAPFNDWMLLNANYSKEMLADLNKLDNNEIIKLSKLPVLSIPFNHRIDLSLIKGEKE